MKSVPHLIPGHIQHPEDASSAWFVHPLIQHCITVLRKTFVIQPFDPSAAAVAHPLLNLGHEHHYPMNHDVSAE